MHRPHSGRATHIVMHILTWDCDEHGPHRVIIAGLDSTADLVAGIIRRHPTDAGGAPRIVRELIPLEDARRAYYGMDTEDDLPY